MKTLCISLFAVASVLFFSGFTFQSDKDYTNEKITKLADEIKTLVNKYPNAAAAYKGKEIKDTLAETESKWFRVKTRFSLAATQAIELEEDTHTLYLNFTGFSNHTMALAFALKLKQKLLQNTYVFGKLEAAATTAGWTPLMPVKGADKKYDGVLVTIDAPDPQAHEDKFGHTRDKDVVVTILL